MARDSIEAFVLARYQHRNELARRTWQIPQPACVSVPLACRFQQPRSMREALHDLRGPRPAAMKLPERTDPPIAAAELWFRRAGGNQLDARHD